VFGISLLPLLLLVMLISLVLLNPRTKRLLPPTTYGVSTLRALVPRSPMSDAPPSVVRTASCATLTLRQTVVKRLWQKLSVLVDSLR